MLPRFDVKGFLPPGRYSVTMEEAQTLLVDAPAFDISTTRRALWSSFQEYLFLFSALEKSYSAELKGRALLHRVWLGGSFVRHGSCSSGL